MADRNVIRDRLLQLVAEDPVVRDGWRRIGTGDEADLLAAFIAEIDETILPRQLAFRNRNGAVLALEAANRRIRRFVSPVPDKLASHSRLFDGAILEPETETLDQIGAALTAHLAASPHLWVRSSQLGTGGHSAQIGISATRLYEALSFPVEQIADADPHRLLERFQAELVLKCETWVQLNGARVVAGSDQELNDNQLENLIRADWGNRMKAQAASTSHPDAPTCCILASSDDPASAIVLVAHETSCLVARTTCQRASEISVLWGNLGLSAEKLSS